MYLREVYIRNSGPLRSLDLQIEQTPDGEPFTYVFLGPNGSGKTNLLSLIADALIEGAADAFQDVVPSSGLSRSWFRMVGTTTVSQDAAGGFSLLKFEEANKSYFYVEKAGTYSPANAKQLLPADSSPAVQWPENGNVKTFDLPAEVAKTLYSRGAYAYFPSSRAEYPHWLNITALKEDRFSTNQVVSTNLSKPLFVEQGVQQFGQWLMGVITDSRVDVGPLLTAVRNSQDAGWLNPSSMSANIQGAIRDLTAYHAANSILQAVLGIPTARFVWAGRHYAKKIAVESHNRIIAPGLDALSAGQASLLSIFGTLLRYGDSQGVQQSENIEGICIVDEIDAHMHVDLQTEALPKLIALFPKIQFLISGHSPLFVLGLHRQLPNRVKFVELPLAASIEAEAYTEFGHAFDAFKDTKALAELIAQDARNLQKAKVFFEGETDPEYFTAAAEVLGYVDLIDSADFEWVGAKDPKSGQGFNTGKEALDRAYALMRAKPGLITQTVVLLYDCDTNKEASDAGTVYVRTIPKNTDNEVAEKGVENLLPAWVFTEDMYDVSTRSKDYGESVTTKTLNKMRLCKTVCACKEGEYFVNFAPVLDELARLIVK